MFHPTSDVVLLKLKADVISKLDVYPFESSSIRAVFRGATWLDWFLVPLSLDWDTLLLLQIFWILLPRMSKLLHFIYNKIYFNFKLFLASRTL